MRNLLPILALVAVLAFVGPWRHSASPPDSATVRRSEFSLWTPLSGRVEPEQARSIRSQFDGAATVTWIMDAGTPVTAEDVVVRFDPSLIEQEVIALERDLRLAQAEERSLLHGRHPLELQALREELLELEDRWEQEAGMLADTRELVLENLLPPRELQAQSAKAERLRARLHNASNRIEVTQTELHPAAVERVRATREAAERALERAQTLRAHCEVRAGADGVVTPVPIHSGNQQRPVRVGDVVYKNQVFMEVADLRNLVIRCQIPEQQISRVQPGMPARLHFPAYPALEAEGLVRRVSTQPTEGGELFGVEVALRQPDDRLRPGLSARLQVLSLVEPAALLLPREAVRFTPQGPECDVLVPGGAPVLRRLRLGPGDAAQFVVLEGLREGERVLLP